jgi:Na+/H+ antiporter NhaD/arsenite permease-like protein
MIIIPLTITVTRILNIDPEPFIITQAVLVNIGGSFFSISSIPNIMIAGSGDIGFNEFFVNVGLISIGCFILTVGLFYLIYRKNINIPPENIRVLKELSPSSMIPNKSLVIKSTVILGTVFLLFIFIPSSIVSPDAIAISGAVILVIISKQEMDQILNEIDIGLLLYLMGIFVIAGSIEFTNILQSLGVLIGNISGDNILLGILSIMWISGLLSATIDNIPITKVLIPAVTSITIGYPTNYQKLALYSLAFGANWGDNFTPMGDNILVMNIAKKNKRPIRIKEFWKIGFISTFYQLSLVTIFYGFLLNWIFGLFALVGFIFIFGMYALMKLQPQILKKNKMKIKNWRLKRKNGYKNSQED